MRQLNSKDSCFRKLHIAQYWILKLEALQLRGPDTITQSVAPTALHASIPHSNNYDTSGIGEHPGGVGGGDECVGEQTLKHWAAGHTCNDPARSLLTLGNTS